MDFASEALPGLNADERVIAELFAQRIKRKPCDVFGVLAERVHYECLCERGGHAARRPCNAADRAARFADAIARINT
ncbi:hypothetical protein [Burkholderia cenocepacia]|uniref:hypothetical protein n=1 Tax=Burkholderia cenocepacia TaxID=95486 RepID=UPI00264C3C25|nr:hypothetical protein [Burkholderia cenocepacia]MDN7457589.1 hypothetical protein [Burkholderia cenocepacia]MEB2544548.1 hypothetical protein [Burkholderia cenocepacia]